MPAKTSQYLLSDPASLRRIKLLQFRSQVPALLLLLLALALNYIFPSANLYKLALLLAIVAIAWFLYLGFCYRYRQRIPIPPEGSLVSPVQGNVRSVQGNDDITLVNIRKMVLDSVEIRSPHQDCTLEDGVLHLALAAGKISFRFNIPRVIWFDNPDFSTGNIIGMAVGAGNCTITLPGSLELDLKPGQALDAGSPIIPNLLEADLRTKPERQVVLEALADFDEESTDI
ncbi:MAG: hypothetical protein BWX75_01148 [Candidatus Cloacimonetes bacterium ADurb.Bin088]|nr:MAG: hypothetical protein BWX75_01148 [Candidatus Cloacimonetes bacterium ADurb.Bin088]